MHGRMLMGLMSVAFFLACSGSSGAVGTTGSTGANPDAPAIHAFQAMPGALAAPGNVTLTWSVSNATTVSIDQGIGVVTGSSMTVPITKTTTFTLTATNAAFSASKSLMVNLDLHGQGQPSITSFTATPSPLPFGGGTVTLAWTVANAASLSIDQGVGAVSGSSTTVPVTVSTTFTLTATNGSHTATAIASVVVDSQVTPAPTIQSFTASPNTLPSGGGTVTLAWQTSDATSLSIDQGVGPVTGLSTTVPVTATTTFTLTATSDAGSATAPATVTVAADVDRYADSVNGTDENDCSHDAPCLTISAALSVADPGTTVRLFDGTYGTTTQGTGTITIPDGIALSAINPGAAVLTSRQLVATGSTSLTGLVFDLEGISGSALTATSATGTPTVALTGVLIKNMDALVIGGSVQATMTPGALTGGLYTAALPNSYGQVITVQGNASLLIQGGVIDGNNVGAPAFGGGLIAVLNNAQLTLDGATIQNRTEVGVVAGGTASITVKNNTVINNVGTVGGDCPTGAAFVLGGVNTLSIDQTQMTGLQDGAICVRVGNAPTIIVTNSTIDSSANGIVSEIGPGTAATVTLDTVKLTNCGAGINWGGFGTSTFSLTNCTIQGNQTGVQFGGAIGDALTMRNSSVLDNTTVGFVAYNGVGIDLGTPADPGGNTLTGNTGSNLKTNLDMGNTTATAVGNTWDVGQGSDANGHYSVAPSYAAVPEMGPASGINYSILNATPLNL